MAGPSEVYLRHEDGAYVAAERSDHIQVNYFVLLLKVLFKVILNIPNFLKDFFNDFIWAPKKSINGSLVLVTGGANGLGKALCQRFARENCRVAVADIDYVSACRTTEEIQRSGAKAEPFKVDVADHQSVQQLRRDIESKLGVVDILVNNAGLLAVGSTWDGTAADVQRIIDVNLTSHFWMIREFKPGMLLGKGGHIVGISSILGRVPNFQSAIYSATKFGVRGLMESLGDELFMNGQSDKLSVTCVYPNLVATRKDLLKAFKDIGVLTSTSTPAQAAEQIMNAVLKNKSEVVLGGLVTRIAVKMNAIVSERMRRLVASVLCEKPNVRQNHQNTAYITRNFNWTTKPPQK